MDLDVLYRPYQSIKKSIQCLDDNLVYITKINSYIFIKHMLESNPINRNMKFYWNKGYVHWKDLMYFYHYSHNEWNKRGGDIYNYLEQNKNLINIIKDKSKNIKLAKVTSYMMNKHRNTLINYHYDFYVDKFN